jgi:dipeptidyl aminopeptidase/acylaminoacyl peptidase
MHNDVTDGVRKLLKSGIVDPHRVAIMGASFGGYLAVCGAAYESDLYRCAVTEAGVFDWTLLMKAARQDQYVSNRYQLFSRNIGEPQNNKDAYAAMSPLNHIESVKCPIFVAHGRSDDNVNIEQSRRLVEELKKHGVPYRTLFKSGEGHGLTQLANQVEYYTAVEQFLAENLAAPVAGTK